MRQKFKQGDIVQVTLDLEARAAKRVETVPPVVIEEALAKRQAAIDSEV